MQEKPSFSEEISEIIEAPEVISTGMAIGAGFVTDVFAGFALEHVREPDPSEEPDEEDEPLPPPQPERHMPEESSALDAPRAEAVQEKRGEIVPVGPREMQYIKPSVETTGSSLSFAAEGTGVIGTIELIEVRGQTASFGAKVVNDSAEMLHCSIVGEHGRDHSPLQPDLFYVEGRSASAVIIDVPLRLWKPYDRVLVTLRNSTMHCALSAGVPRNPFIRPIAAAAAVLLVVLAVLVGLNAAAPRIAAYAVPPSTLAGSEVRAEYAIHGIGTATYQVVAVAEAAPSTAGRGASRTIASGTLSMGSGFFAFNTPARPDQYRITLAVRGPLGHTSENRMLETVTAKPSTIIAASPQLIRSFEVEDAIVKSGRPIVVRYFASGQGQVRLLDTLQIPVLSHPSDVNGVTKLMAPDVTRDTPFRLELVMNQGAATQSASVGILVQPASVKATLRAPDAGVDTNLAKISAKDLAAANAASKDIESSKLFALTPAHPVSGSTLQVRVLQAVDNLRLTLQDARGVPLNIRDVKPTEKTVMLPLPPVGVDSNFIVIATFDRATSAHTVILPFVVYAR